jgi:hypothetical protein
MAAVALHTVAVWLAAELPLLYRRVWVVDWVSQSDITVSDAITGRGAGCESKSFFDHR